MRPGRSWLGALVFACGALAGGSAGALDLHRLWDDRCQDCHGHAGPFARAFLVVADGQLYGRSPQRDLRRFLANHYLAGREVEAVYAMLQAQAQTRGQYQKQCSACHGPAARLARESLMFEQGRLHGRSSGRAVSEFLATHMALSAEEVAFYATLLERVAREVDLH